jgi:hypothetical protein
MFSVTPVLTSYRPRSSQVDGALRVRNDGISFRAGIGTDGKALLPPLVGARAARSNYPSLTARINLAVSSVSPIVHNSYRFGSHKTY